MSTSNPSFNPTCPSGGSWYACGNGVKFTGCCRSNPCNNNGCPQGNLTPASFDATKYGQFPDQQCGIGSWYTCATTSPTFLGCCRSNPCKPGGCPTSDLVAGFLSNNVAAALAFDPEPPLSSTISSASSSSSSRTQSSSSTRTQSSSSIRIQSSSTRTQSSSTTRTSSVVSTSTATIKSSSTTTSAAAATATLLNAAPSTSSTNIPAIAGGAAGGVAVLLIILFAFWRWHRHMKRSRQEQHNSFIGRSTIHATESAGPVSAYAKHSDDKSASATLLGYTPDVYQDPGLPPPPFRSTPPSPHYSDPSQVPMIHEAASRELYRSYSPYTSPSGFTSPATVPYRSVNSWTPTQEMYASPNSWPVGGVHHVGESGYGQATELDGRSRRER